MPAILFVLSLLFANPQSETTTTDNPTEQTTSDGRNNDNGCDFIIITELDAP